MVTVVYSNLSIPALSNNSTSNGYWVNSGHKNLSAYNPIPYPVSVTAELPAVNYTDTNGKRCWWARGVRIIDNCPYTAANQIMDWCRPYQTIDHAFTGTVGQPAVTWSLGTVNGDTSYWLTAVQSIGSLDTKSGTAGAPAQTWVIKYTYTLPSATSGSVSLVTATSARVTVTANSAYEYIIQCKKKTDGGFPDRFQQASNIRDFTGLAANTTYTTNFCYSRKNRDGNLYPGDVAGFDFLTLPSNPSTPTISNITTSSFSASWAAPSNGCASYDYAITETNSAPSTVTNTTALTVTISGKTAGKTYYVWVRSKNSAGTSSWSGPVSVILPPPPTPSVNAVIESNTVYLNWATTTSATKYQYAATTTATAPTSGTETTQISVILTKGSNQYFWVRAGNSGGWGGWVQALVETIIVPTITGAWVNGNRMIIAYQNNNLITRMWKNGAPFFG